MLVVIDVHCKGVGNTRKIYILCYAVHVYAMTIRFVSRMKNSGMKMFVISFEVLKIKTCDRLKEGIY